jgi:hypothetical protein
MFNTPAKFLNGTAPLNVTGYQAHSNLTGGDTVLLPSPGAVFLYAFLVGDPR